MIAAIALRHFYALIQMLIGRPLIPASATDHVIVCRKACCAVLKYIHGQIFPFSIAIDAPFGHIAVNIIQSPRIGSIAADLRRAIFRRDVSPDVSRRCRVRRPASSVLGTSQFGHYRISVAILGIVLAIVPDRLRACTCGILPIHLLRQIK